MCPGRFAGLCALLLFTATSSMLIAQTLVYTRKPDPKNGKIVYNGGCIACHGVNGKGAPSKNTEFKRPDTFPDFSRCDQTTPEPDSAWKAVIVYGGPYYGFSAIMPSFKDLLSNDQIDDVVAYLRTFCPNPHWPRGELNLPRALVTEKAFPEDEFVLSTAINASGAPGLTTDFIHEQAFGTKGQLEVDVPWDYQDQNHNWNSHVGDITFGWKQVMYSNFHTGSIFALQGSILPPRAAPNSTATAPLCLSPSPHSTSSSALTPGFNFRWAPTFRAIPTSHRRASSSIRPLVRPLRLIIVSAANGPRWWSSSPRAISRTVREQTGTSCRRCR